MKKALSTLCLFLGLSGTIVPLQASAHPHVYVDGGIDFIFEDGRLTRLRITWLYDAFYSLYILQEEGIDSDADGIVTPDEKARLAVRETSWIENFDGDSFLWQGDTRIGLSYPIDATGDLVDGQVKIVFDRMLETPLAPGNDIYAKAFDPAYYSAYGITADPVVIGMDDCTATVFRFVPEGAIGALQADLSALGRDETPEMPNIGELFADRIDLSCD